MGIKRKLTAKLNKIEIPSMEEALEKTDYVPSEKQSKIKIKKKLIMRRILVPSLCLVLTFFTVFGVYAYSPEFKQYINMLFFKNNERLTVADLKETQTPIYTIDDLDKVRTESGSYVLMNDLYFTDSDYEEGGKFSGGFEPINDGISVKSEDGREMIETDKKIVLNGNGYVIHNLQIIAKDLNRVGLFGNVKEVINLGIDNCVLNYTGIPRHTKYDIDDLYYPSGLNIGVIAGRADRIMGCYVTNSTINIDVESTPEEFAVGGICGKAELIDSCYGDIVVNGNINGFESSIDNNSNAYKKSNTIPLYFGGIVGVSDACVTSYFYGNLNIDNDYNYRDIISDNISAKSLSVPLVLHQSQYEVILFDLKEVFTDKESGENHFLYRKFQAYYLNKDKDKFLDIEKQGYFAKWRSFQDYYFCDVSSWSNSWYLYDPNASLREDIGIMEILKIVYTDEEIKEMFDSFGVKYGKYGCKTIDKDQKYRQEDFEDFDFEHIWIMKEGHPALRIFQK